ncbi:hypothetical protein GE061_008624, partial [Apolygus lucorum]
MVHLTALTLDSLRDFGCAESVSLPRLGPPIQPLSTSWFQRLRLPSTASDFFNTQDCKTTTAPTLHGLLQLLGFSIHKALVLPSVIFSDVLPAFSLKIQDGRFGHGGGVMHSGVADPSVKIGAREVVGFGYNGVPTYVDRFDFPLPAVRWRPETPDIKDLRQKEKGDWKSLTVAEKKALYRASFCQTFAEMNAPNGEWKSILGGTLLLASSAVWLYMFFRLFGTLILV